MVTLIPRGHSLGATEQIPDEDRLNRSKSSFLDRLTMMLGGRCSDRVIDTGPSEGRQSGHG
jgi:cell division protease FtsH